MTRKIFVGIISVSLIIMLVCTGLVTGIMYDYMGKKIDVELENQGALVEAAWLTSGDIFLKKIPEYEQLDTRITLIDVAGNVLYDSMASASQMENHLKREEVQEAFAQGSGFAVRTSNTLTQDTRYYAKRMADGNILRVSTNHNSQLRLLADNFATLMLALAALLLFSVVISHRVTKAIIKPINQIDLDTLEIEESYEEIAPLLLRIRQQNHKIQWQLEKLRKNREEFNIITENMSEGLIIIGQDTEILSYNSSAIKMLAAEGSEGGQTNSEIRRTNSESRQVNSESRQVNSESRPRAAEGGPITGSVLRLNRSEAFRKAVSSAVAGKSCESIMTVGPRAYEIMANPVKDKNAVSGAILIIVDITEKQNGERLRREFTSNVSHELKTPLTSIYGVSDMMTTGIVKPEDIPSFAKTIKDESSRLISLIEDIIKLSQLDENNIPLEKEAVDLVGVAKESIRRLETKAREKEVYIDTEDLLDEPVEILAVEYIADEIIYNLVENAIKYNNRGGFVKVSLKKTPANLAILRVEDNGKGIPKQDLDRVFERFYRVDKSHSNATSGTGLGLSIVKHAVAFLGGTIELESHEGKGTKITVIFPLMSCENE